MRRFAIGTNHYYFTATIYLEEAKWYIFTLEKIMDFICHYMPRIPLPKIKIIREKENYTLRSYYGTIADLFHVYIHMPIFNWCCNKTEAVPINFPYNKLKELFPKDFENLYSAEEIDEEIKENKYFSEIVQRQFNIAYDDLTEITKTQMNKKER